MKQHLNHTIGIVLVLPLLVFFFYKSISNSDPYGTLSSITDEIESLHVRLHRDILRYRNNQLREYDTLNETAHRLAGLNEKLGTAVDREEHQALAEQLTQLHTLNDEQNLLLEDFKTNNSVLQNSLYYYSRLHSEVRTENSADSDNTVNAELLGTLSTLILEYTRKPGQETALKIYPLLDELKATQREELNTLVDHTLIIIERLPVLDGIIADFDRLDIEHQIESIKQLLAKQRANLEQHSVIYNALLFFSALYLLGYIGYMVLLLNQSKNTLVVANEKLNREVEERTRTEKTLYRLVKETSYVGEDDFIHDILYALYKSLGYRYSYFARLVENTNRVKVLGLVDNGRYRSDISHDIAGTPCEEILRDGRLVHNRDFRNYFPNWDQNCIPDADSFIGITVKDRNNRVTGLLAVADDKAIGNSNLAENILFLAASRISSELLRHDALQHTQRYHSGLESIDSWLVELISCGADTGPFYSTVCEAALAISNASVAFVSLLDERGDNYVITAAAGDGAEMLSGTSHELGDGGLFSWTLTNKKALRVDDLSTDMRARRQLINRSRVNSACVTPVFLNDEIFGAIAVFRQNPTFDPIDEQLMRQFTQRVQLAVANMTLVSDIATEKERAEFTLRSIGDAVITTDAEGRIEYMNPIAERLTGWTLNRVQNQPVQTVFRILDHDTREPIHNVIEACLNEGTAISKSMTYLINHNGSERSIESSMSPIINRHGSTEGAVIVFHDETERRRMECIIHHQATHDSLTGLVNREQFNGELNELIHHASTHEAQHALCYLDLDRFKTVNDTCGHAAGDELLKQVSSRLHASIRSGDMLGRLGGDEFGLLLKNCPLDAATRIAAKIIETVAEHEFIWEGNQFTIGVSIGIVPITADTESIVEALKHADAACYTAKHQGRNRCYVYDQQDTRLVQRQEELHWASRISRALEQNRFRIHAQTICPLDPAASDTAHIEILVRMEDENGQLIPPAAFIPAAERYDLMAAVDQHIIRETFKFIASNENDDIRVSINLSASSLNDDNLAHFINQCTKEYGVSPELVCFEINESAAINNLAKTRRIIDELQPDGFRFALDDFGSKLSSFSYLDNLPVDYVKIDGSFVREMVDNNIDHAMVAAINQIGHIMQIKTIAEFVENDDIIAKLRSLGVDFAQGYGISRPRPLTDATLRDMIRQGRFKNGLVSAS